MLYKSALVLLVLLLIGWSALSGTVAAERPAHADATGGLSLYLNLPGSAVLLAPAVTPSAARIGLPNSTLPHAFLECSARDDTAATVRCSVQPTGRCSLNCDQNGLCTAFVTGQALGPALCSTHDGNLQRRCSVLPPPAPTPGFTGCTTASTGGPGLPGGSSACSVFATTGACSVENVPGGTALGECSVGTRSCSVLNVGSAERGFCSVAKQGLKVCSAFSIDPAQLGVCSIFAGARGVCTSFKGALPGDCSAFGDPGNHCSVDGGPGPNANGKCRLP